MLCLCLSLFENTRDTSIMHEKAKFVCFIYMQPQKMKFKSVQINMKQVSYLIICGKICLVTLAIMVLLRILHACSCIIEFVKRVV